MSYNSRLKIVKIGEEPKYISIMSVAQSASISAMKTDYKVVEGNRISGIERGIGLTTAGRQFTYNVPIYEIRNLEGKENFDNDIYKNIAKYTSLLMNSYAYDFYIEHFINGIWYKAKVQITEISNYTVEIVNYIKSFSFKCQMIDNYFLGEEVSEDIGIKGSGLQSINYKSKAFVPSPFGFEWTLQGLGPTLSAWIVHNDNYGIVINTYLGEGTFILNYDGNILLIDGVSIPFEGVQPFLNIEDNVLVINSTYNTVSFLIKYRNGIAL